MKKLIGIGMTVAFLLLGANAQACFKHDSNITHAAYVLTQAKLNYFIGKDKFFRKYPNLPSAQHSFITKTSKQVLEAAQKKESFILFLGFPSCPWCQAIVTSVDKAAKQLSLPEIWYVDIKQERKELSQNYLAILDLIGFQRPQEGKETLSGYDRVSAPTLAIINKGEIAYYDYKAITFADPEAKVENGHSKSMDGKVLATYMWDDSVVKKSKVYDGTIEGNNKVKLADGVEKALYDEIINLFDYSVCGSCEI